ncbi:unnamed protein product [Paramecium primaurelia]|uniref:START domain-containing protein n=1 Tax=Paramecium primaurelia TaxID=5886 RepID=A0A8S1KTT8_PARPR|nr:unnamed protein product [Paramecium primaurelia]
MQKNVNFHEMLQQAIKLENINEELENLKIIFSELISSSLNDNEKLNIYYEINLILTSLLEQTNRSIEEKIEIKNLMNIMMNNLEVQEFMYRIADEETNQIQEVRSLSINYKASRIGRAYITQRAEQQQQQQQQYTENQILILNVDICQEQQIQFYDNNYSQQSKEEQSLIQSPPSKRYIEIAQDELSELINRSKYEFDQTKIDQAYEYAKLAQDKFKSDINYQQYAEYVDQIIVQYNYMFDNVKELDSDGWIFDGQSNGISVKYKFPENTSTASMLMETKIPVNAIRVLALVNEMDLNYLWVPFCKRTYVNKVLNRACKVCTSEMYFPLIPDRECVFVGEGYDRLSVNGTITLLSRSVDSDKEFLEKNGIFIPEKSKFIRMYIKYYIFEITPIDKDSCSIRACTNVNPKISMVPNSVLAYIGRKFAHILIQKIVNFAKTFEKSPFYPVYLEHIEFYNWLEEKLKNHLKY